MICDQRIARNLEPARKSYDGWRHGATNDLSNALNGLPDLAQILEQASDSHPRET